MKKILILIIAAFYLTIVEASAQNYTFVDSSVPVSTQSNNGRYEFIQSTNNSSHAFLLDKFTGEVWRYRIGRKEFEKLKEKLFTTKRMIDCAQRKNFKSTLLETS